MQYAVSKGNIACARVQIGIHVGECPQGEGML